VRILEALQDADEWEERHTEAAQVVFENYDLYYASVANRIGDVSFIQQNQVPAGRWMIPIMCFYQHRCPSNLPAIGGPENYRRQVLALPFTCLSLPLARWQSTQWRKRLLF
jgi:hypothetical protein